jgi:hypothetical protein
MKSARLLVLALAGCGGVANAAAPEVFHYLRVASQRKALECSFAILRSADGWTITSVTGDLTVEARYDAQDRLRGGHASLRNGGTARVLVAGGRARLTAPGREDEEMEAPPGVIVTSAPDWTDAFRICRLWDRARAGRQEFPGLWIHPVQPARRLTFSAEGVRRDRLDQGPTTLDLDVLTIRLRGNSAYRAWADPAGRMIKLASLPAGEGSTVLVLEGFESAASALPGE